MAKKFHSIKNRLFIILLSLSLGSMILMSIVGYASMTEIEDKATGVMLQKHEDMFQIIVHKQAEITNEIITRTEQAIAILSESLYWTESADSTIDDVLKAMKDNNPYVYNTFIAHPDGTARFYSKDLDLKRDDSYDPRIKKWYKNAVETKQMVWSEVYKGSLSGKLMITCSKILYDRDSTIAAVIGVDLTIDAINEIINTDDVDMAYSFLVDGNGKLIARPQYESKDERWDEILSIPLGNHMSEVNDDNFKDILNKCINQDSGFEYWDRGDSSKYIAFNTATNQNWTLGIVISEAYIQDDIEKSFTDQFKATSKYFVLMIIVVTLIVIYVGLKISQRITKPISILNSGAKKIGAGDLNYNIEINTSDELENLANEFNTMSTDLQHYITDLEESTKQKERIQSELNIASKIQQDMLPLIFPPFPDKPQIDIFGSMHAAKMVGGDFYDFFLINENKLGFVIADVSGKGIPASLFMVISKTLIKSEAMSGISPAEVLANVNKTLLEGNDEMMFVTVLLCMLDLETGELTFANGGHNPPLIGKHESDFDYVELNKAKVVGVFDRATFSNQTIQMEKGDTIFLYTDGVTEAMNPVSEQFTEDRLINTMKGLNTSSVKMIKEKVLDDVERFVDGAEQSDDITTLVVKYNG